MLRQHPYGFVFGDAVVEVVPYAEQKIIEGLADFRVRVTEEGADSGFVPSGYLADVVRPRLPVSRVGVLIHHLCENGIPEFGRTRDEQHSLNAFGRIWVVGIFPIIVFVPKVGDGRVAAQVFFFGVNRRVIYGQQRQVVDLRLEPVIVGADGVDNLPDRLVRAVVD